tara:strand:- start:282 stop:563 length:282 start_codon:yes stop_codon:yes gene_type:complete
MSKQKPKKPTNKDRDEAINSLIANTQWLRNQFELIGRLFDAYIEFNGDTKKFMEHIDDIKRKYEESQKEAPDEPEINEDPNAELDEASTEDQG